MKNKKKLIIAGSVAAVIVIGLIIYFAVANKSTKDTEDVKTKSSSEVIDEEVDVSSDIDVPELGETIEIQSDEDEEADDKKADDKKADDKKADDKKADDKKVDDKKADDKKADDKKADDKKADDKKADEKKTEDKKTEDKKTEDKKSEDKKSEDKKSDTKKTEDIERETIPITLPDPAAVPEAKSSEGKKEVGVTSQPEENKYADANIYTNKDGQLAAKTDSGKEVEFTSDYMQKLFDEYEKVKGKDPKREKEILDELQLIMDNHEVMELKEKE